MKNRQRLSFFGHSVIERLILEAINGEITPLTMDSVAVLGDPSEIELPYAHLISFVNGYQLNDMKYLADMLLEEIRIISVEAKEDRSLGKLIS